MSDILVRCSSPSAETLARDYKSLSLVWHLLLLACLGWPLYSRRSPKLRLAFALACGPLLTATAVAWLGGEQLVALELSALCAVSALILAILPHQPVTWARGNTRRLAVASIAIATCYPSFIHELSLLGVVYAPLGVLPAPTLFWLAGTGLLFRGFESRIWSYWVATLALGYALLGAAVHGCLLETMLIPVAISLISLVTPSRPKQRVREHRRAARAGAGSVHDA